MLTRGMKSLIQGGGSFFTYSSSFLLTVESVEVLLRHTFPL